MRPTDSLVHTVSVDPSTKTTDPRHVARELAVQFLYQLDVQKGASLDLLERFLNEYSQDPAARQLAQRFILNTWKNCPQLDEIIRKVSRNWDFNRISLVDRSNLRLAVFQLLYCPDIPYKVVINEAVELAKYFSTAQAPAFINGVLDVIKKQIHRPADDSTDAVPPPLKE